MAVLGFGKEDSPVRLRKQSMTSDLAMSLTKQEFASALGMKKDEIFVQKMFNIVDKEKSGRISFQNFLDTVVLFTKGSSEEKLRIIFNMCEAEEGGTVNKAELKEVLTSLIEIAKTDKIKGNTETFTTFESTIKKILLRCLIAFLKKT